VYWGGKEEHLTMWGLFMEDFARDIDEAEIQGPRTSRR
jgi:hypothetical protein